MFEDCLQCWLCVMYVQLVQQADGLFKYYVANTYMTNIPLLCLLLYRVIVSSSAASAAHHTASIFHCCHTAYQMITVSVTAIIISTQVARITSLDVAPTSLETI